jgi:Protein of unknown function (DUF1688)
MKGEHRQNQDLELLQMPATIRDRAHQLFNLGLAGDLPYFRVNFDRLDAVADYVIAITRQRYPDFQIPFHSRWRHFPTDRIDALLADLAPIDRAKAKLDLVIPSVLLDAGAGADWHYTDAAGQIWQRSEGLAIASLDLFASGSFSQFGTQTTDAVGLQNLSLERLQQGFQISDRNPLIGLAGRWQLLQKLGQQWPSVRLGDWIDRLQAEDRDRVSADRLFRLVLAEIGPIWSAPGDVGQHRAIGHLPFHKLAQWLTYSLLEPLQELGMTIEDLPALTGLAEYRNGGLCIDLELLQLHDPAQAQVIHPITAEIIVEWRGLTIAALDHIADRLREKLGCTATELPLVKILQGGTWSAGRAIAQTLRPQATPPLQIFSDGTFF